MSQDLWLGWWGLDTLFIIASAAYFGTPSSDGWERPTLGSQFLTCLAWLPHPGSC